MSANLSGEAVVMRRYGPPAVLILEHVPLTAVAEDEIRIRSLASAVNHSDLEIRAGKWPIRKSDPFPYVPGLEAVGEVVMRGSAVSDFEIGDRVITMMQGLGGVRAVRPGGYAEFVTVRASAAAGICPNVDVLDVAALGLASVTAFEGLQKLGALGGRRIVVTGASGGVGSAAVGLAKSQGAHVLAVVTRRAQQEYVSSLGAAEAFEARDVAAGALGEATVDGVLDTVAGELFAPCVNALRTGASLSLVGAVGGNQVTFDAYHLMTGTLTGYSSETLDGAGLRRAITAITDLLRHGKLTPPSRTLFPLAEASTAHEQLEKHVVQGRVLLVPEPGPARQEAKT